MFVENCVKVVLNLDQRYDFQFMSGTKLSERPIFNYASIYNLFSLHYTSFTKKYIYKK